MSPALTVQPRSVAIAALAVLLTAAPSGALLAADAAVAEFFEKQVRPILAARCFECHSNRASPPKGGLRLDSRALALKGGDTGPAVVPGDARKSLLVDAINYGELYQMPPKSRLLAEEIAVLTKWVEKGAPWPESQVQGTGDRGQGTNSVFDLAKRKAEHWCWQPIKRPEVPAIQNPKSKIPNPIDAFIQAKLEARSLSLSPPADPRTLIRRAYFDVIGLPPTTEELEKTFSLPPSLLPSVPPSAQDRGTERQSDPERAYAALLDRLLASPHFGERWGRHWLDLVRYAESRGHEFDYTIPNAFEYRDYVIRALNADVPYDQFLIEHVAGDLLPTPRLHPRDGFQESMIGTGFWFLGEWCHSPVDIRKDECDRIDNMLDVFSKTFLGVTVACARCHDHKFDAISQRDYYALAGYLQSSSYRLARFQTWEQDRKIAAELSDLDAKYRPQIAAQVAKSLRPKLEELLAQFTKDAAALQLELGALASDFRGTEMIVDYSNPRPGQWMVDGPTFHRVRPGQVLISDDPSLPLEIAAEGGARCNSAWGDLGQASISENDPGRLNSLPRAGRTLKTPTFTLKNGQVHYLIEGTGHVYASVDSHAMINGPLHAELLKDIGGNNDLPRRWITHDLSRYVGERVHLEFIAKDGEDFRIFNVVEGPARPTSPENTANRLIEQATAAADSASRGANLQRLLAKTLDLLAADRIDDDPQAADRAAIANWLLAQSKLDAAPDTQLQSLCAAFASAKAAVTERIGTHSRLCLALWDGTPVDEHLLIRGNHKTTGPVVPRWTLEALEESGVRGQESGGSGRLGLARQLVDRSNPLVARVIVNRVWQQLMGRGIVPTPDNLGVLGQPPTHPELLDYLADELVRDSWSIKRLIRRIMLSSTYRQGSGFVSQESELADPQNLLFHRQSLKRLEGEAIRDAILAVSGRLDSAQHGPSVPVYLTPFMQGRGRPKDSGPLDGAGRRSIYTAVRRNFLPPMMLAFDTPTPFTTIGRRNVSNVPAQALTLLNDPFVAEQVRIWARQLLIGSPHISSAARVRDMYLAAAGRDPTAAEIGAAVTFLNEQAIEYGCSTNDERVWADLAHTIFNVKNFVFVE